MRIMEPTPATVRCFDCGREAPYGQTREMLYRGPETVPNPRTVRVCDACWNAAHPAATASDKA